jgi:hypothetical protein
MSSAGFSGPIDVWFWATDIDMAVKEFADENGLECALRPHGEHIWYVRKSSEPEPDFFQQVQVAAFHRHGEESAIFFTPFAYVMAHSNSRITPPGAASTGILQLKTLGPQLHEALKMELREAWSRAQQLKRHNVSLNPA